MTKRPLKFKLDAYRMYASGLSSIEAFQAASKMNGDIQLSGCMTTKAYASGYMSDDIKNRIRDKIKARDAETVAYFAEWKLDEEF